MNDTEPPSDPGYREDTQTRVEKLRIRAAAAADAIEDHEERLRKAEALPFRALIAVLTAAAGIVGTGIAGIQSMTRVEAAVESLSARIERLEYQDDHRWRRVDTATHEGE